MSRKPNPVPVLGHVNPDKLRTRQAVAARRRLSRQLCVTPAVTPTGIADQPNFNAMIEGLFAPDPDGVVLASALAEMDREADAAARVLGTKKKEPGDE